MPSAMRPNVVETVPTVLICEVGPRDGLQSVAATMPTAAKLRWIDVLVASGLREIEVASVVPARLLPQMADAHAVVRHALTHSGVTVMALVPILRGAQAALEAGVHKLSIPVSASAAHSMANVQKTGEAMVEEVRAIVRLCREHFPAVQIEAGISTAFGCTMQGPVPEDDVVRLAEQVVPSGRGPVWSGGHYRHGQPGAGAAAVHALARRHRRQGRCGTHAQHPRSGFGQLPCSL